MMRDKVKPTCSWQHLLKRGVLISEIKRFVTFVFTVWGSIKILMVCLKWNQWAYIRSVSAEREPDCSV